MLVNENSAVLNCAANVGFSFENKTYKFMFFGQKIKVKYSSAEVFLSRGDFAIQSQRSSQPLAVSHKKT